MDYEMSETELRDFIRRMLSPTGIEKSPARGGVSRQGSKRKEVQSLHFTTSAEGCKHAFSTGKAGICVCPDTER